MSNTLNDLVDFRNQIDALDKDLLLLLNKRAHLAKEIGVIKAANGMDIYDPTRENEVLSKATVLNAGPLSNGAVQDVFNCVITVCREIQNAD